jgi:hypothetical protein
MTRKSLLSGGAGAASCLVAGLLYLSPQPAAAQSSGATASERITVIGCVERADQLAATGPAASANVDSQMFVLMKADDNDHSTDATRPVGTSGTGPLYWLDGDKAQLNLRVGQKVEISGTRMDATVSGAPAQPNADNPNPVNAPRLKVDTTKVIAETCPR